MRIYLDYDRSIRCAIGRHDKGDAESGCQGGFKPILGRSVRFCLCDCHDAEPPRSAPSTYHYRITPIMKTPAGDDEENATHTIEPRRDGFDLRAIIWDEVTEFAAETVMYGEPLAVTRRNVEAIVAAASTDPIPEPLTIRWAARAHDAVTPLAPLRSLRQVRRADEIPPWFTGTRKRDPQP